MKVLLPYYVSVNLCEESFVQFWFVFYDDTTKNILSYGFLISKTMKTSAYSRNYVLDT